MKEAKTRDQKNAAATKTREVLLPPEAIMATYYDQFEKGVKPPTGNAEKWFKSALAHAPNDLATRQVVAIWALEKGMVDFAKVQAENALRIEEADAALPEKDRKYAGSNVGHILRGLVALWQKDWPEAEKDFQQVIYDSPNDFVARNNIALALVEQSDQVKKNKALTYAQTNYKDNTKSPDALSTLGWVCFRRGEFDQAGLALQEAIKAAGGLNNLDTATYWAHILHHSSRDWEAKELLENIIKSEQPFSMSKEAKELYERVKDAKNPNPPATPTLPTLPATGGGR